MAQTTVSVRMDDTLKHDFDAVCNDLGLSMTTAITMLAKKMTREKRLPFDVSIDPFFSDENMARLRRSIAQMEATGGTVHEVNLSGLGVIGCGDDCNFVPYLRRSGHEGQILFATGKTIHAVNKFKPLFSEEKFCVGGQTHRIAASSCICLDVRVSCRLCIRRIRIGTTALVAARYKKHAAAKDRKRT